jgi:hypothetical protein
MSGPVKYGPDGAQGLGPLRLPFAASQQFHELGCAFTYADASGHQALALTATATLFGWALLGFSPQAPEVSGTHGARKFTTSSTAATKYDCKPLTGSEYIWGIGDASFSESDRGNACDLIGVNDGTQQKIDIGTSSTDVLRIIGGDGTAILVAVNPSKLQADT